MAKSSNRNKKSIQFDRQGRLVITDPRLKKLPKRIRVKGILSLGVKNPPPVPPPNLMCPCDLRLGRLKRDSRPVPRGRK